jgi:hypothetical protein
MYNMPVRPIFPADSTSEPRLPQLKAVHWRGVLAVLGLSAAIGVVVAAPLADRTLVPASFVEPTMSYDTNTSDYSELQYTVRETAGEPAISIPPPRIECLMPEC